MSDPTPVLVPRENVNDESATLVAWLVADGGRVGPGQAVVQVETSKAVVDLPATAPGLLRHGARAGDEVAVGAAVGWVVAEGAAARDDAPPTPPAFGAKANGHGPGPEHRNGNGNGDGNGHGAFPLSPSVRRIVAEEKVDPGRVRGTGRDGRITKGDVLAFLTGPAPGAGAPCPGVTRFSRKARDLVAQLGLDESAFAGRGLVRASDVLAAASPGPDPAAPPPPAPGPAETASKPVAASGVPTRSEPLPRSKRTEAKYLRSGLEATLPSVVTVSRPTRGFRDAVRRQAGAGGNPAAVIVFEAARLLKKYPAFNAYHDDGDVRYYEQVHVGFAVDDGRGLKVPVVRDADRKGIAAIASEMRERVVAYVDGALTVDSLAGGTFTVTDLSAEGVTSFHPLINRGQAAILGVCAEAFAPGSASGSFNLILAFDHQLSEGRTAARFLNELGERLSAYEPTAARRDQDADGEPRCSRCQAGFRRLAEDGHALLQSVGGDGSVRLICRLCFEGWV